MIFKDLEHQFLWLFSASSREDAEVKLFCWEKLEIFHNLTISALRLPTAK